MAVAYIVRARTDLPAGAVQITDLAPNSSQRTVYQMAGQSGYLPPLYQDDTIVGYTAANITTAVRVGLAAWAVDTIAVLAGPNFGMTEADADDIADDIFAAAQAALAAGTNLDTTAVNTAIQLTIAGSGIGLSTSVGTLVEVLRILAGEVYTVPAGTAVDGTGAFKGSADGTFDSDAGVARGYRKIYQTGSLQISAGEGDLYNLGLATSSYAVSGTAVAGGFVAAFQPDGTLLNG
jgi:hypothetical protein